MGQESAVRFAVIGVAEASADKLILPGTKGIGLLTVPSVAEATCYYQRRNDGY